MRQVLVAGALGRPRGMGWGGRREGGSGWGTHVNPWLTHVNVRQKPLKYCKVINFQLIKINGEKKKTNKFPSLRECHFFPARTITNKLKLIKRLLAIAVTLSLNSALSMKFKLGETGVKHFTLLKIK